MTFYTEVQESIPCKEVLEKILSTAKPALMSSTLAMDGIQSSEEMAAITSQQEMVVMSYG